MSDKSGDLVIGEARVDKRIPDARITTYQLRLPYIENGGTDRWTLELNKYQRDNLLELMRRTEHFANTGDWYGEIRNVLEMGTRETSPNPMYLGK